MKNILRALAMVTSTTTSLKKVMSINMEKIINVMIKSVITKSAKTRKRAKMKTKNLKVMKRNPEMVKRNHGTAIGAKKNAAKMIKSIRMMRKVKGIIIVTIGRIGEQ